MSAFSRLTLTLVAIATALSSSAAFAASPIDLDLYARLLSEYTRESKDLVGVRVDYKALRGNADWKKLVKEVKAAQPSRLSQRDQKAYWINAYNILTIDLILDHYPVESIKDIGSFFSPVWDREVARIDGQPRSLGEIEHQILRPLGDARIHAAIVCASTSCPPLARTPFRPETLETDLDAAMRAWLASDEKGVRIDRPTNSVRVSKIFSWFEEDFERKGGVLATIAEYVPEEEAAWLRGKGQRARLSYFGYDWSLNSVR